MDLLDAQFNSGPLSLEEIKTVLGSDFATAWGALSKKFKASEKGLFFNERMEAEKLKRRTYVESRKNNLLGSNAHMGAHKAGHMGNINGDVSQEGDARGRGVFKRPSLAEVKAYCQERHNSIDPQAFLDHYDSNGWKVGKNSMKNWKASIHTWERNAGQFQQAIDPKKTPPPVDNSPAALGARKAAQQLREKYGLK
jgi:hypothetical protein